MNVAGCWTCKIRKKKCDVQDDQVSGSCGTCIRLKLECLGFGLASRPEWIRDLGALKEYQTRLKEVTLSNKRATALAGRERARASTTSKKQGKAARGSSTPSFPTRNSSADASSSSTSSTISLRRRPPTPHPHDYQPSVTHITTRNSTSLYWGVAYRYYYPDVSEFHISGIVDAIMEHAPLSPLANLVVEFPALHTEATLHDPHIQPWSSVDSQYVQLCHRTVAAFIPGKTDITDDHVVAAQHLLGYHVMTTTSGTARPKVIKVFGAMVKHSSVIPNQRPRERGAITQQAISNLELLAILGTNVEDSNDRHSHECLDSMHDSTRTILDSIRALSRWKVALETSQAEDPVELARRGEIIQQQICAPRGFHAAQGIGVLLTERQMCEDVERAGCLLYLHCILSDFKPRLIDAPAVIASVDLVVYLFQKLPFKLTARHTRALMLPLTLSAAVNQNPKYQLRVWLNDFFSRNRTVDEEADIDS